jgi:hypothetical protein
METGNPFPGPQPYRAGDRPRFFGREDLAYHLVAGILARRSVTVYGPVGAGRASVMRASVLPSLAESHEARVVGVSTWPAEQDPTAWLAMSLHADLGLSFSSSDLRADEQLRSAAQRAARRSPRLCVLYLAGVEQLLDQDHDAAWTDALFANLEELAASPLRNVRVVLSVREDALGVLHDRLRALPRLAEWSVRVAPLTIAELADAACRAAAAGVPPQTWSLDETRALLRELGAPGQAAGDDAGIPATHAQIVCRALFEARGRGELLAKGAAHAGPLLAGTLEANRTRGEERR